jgi:DNA polymerase III epsilon subunit family exonuclease
MSLEEILRKTDWSKISGRTIIIADLETTGLNEKEDIIIEIGAVKVSEGMLKPEEFSRIIKTNRTIPTEITEITGITNELIDIEGIPFYEAFGDFKQFIGSNDLNTYNAKFDGKFIKALTNKYNIPFTNYVGCSMLLCRKAFALKGMKLSDVAEHLNIINTNSHRALPDCVTTLECHLNALHELSLLNKK